MPIYRDIPPKWWAIVLGVFFGSMALITINGAREGYGKAVLTAAGIAPLLCLVAGALLPTGTSLEMAALVGGVTALGGTALVLGLAKKAPLILGAAVEAAARSYLTVDKGETTRIRDDQTPAAPNPELEQMARKIDDDNS
ncbi:hypothetical protein [Croceicoccus sp. YJ47]|uniref:hypothetical protein n=1 Tax=Croceicoccus sp. YJ47 TaxID=2798724 RepID=UPI001922972E|nr:hypothetical protein [Croceicoccus sp. YJ47]QQN73964.1 hypothetical protein JD971_14640 [Croceicoccus sp. YJ47]